MDMLLEVDSAVLADAGEPLGKLDVPLKIAEDAAAANGDSR